MDEEERKTTQDRVLDAALAHVAFDGWTETTLRAAIAESGAEPALARALFPRGAVDLALYWHERGDRAMLDRLAVTDLADMRFRDRVQTALRLRIEAIGDKEALRRSMALFALPLHAPDGTRVLWRTCDHVWTALGDTSDDVNWYTKRMSLSGVYSATLLYWLADGSSNDADTWAFLARRIDEVMRIERLKGQVQANPLMKPFLVIPNWLGRQVRAPKGVDDLPGSTKPSR
ncbi:COQ9 family protein [Pontibaca methylaminivorans]|uniref:Ubiquinone biosynthesis protein COQ9 n=1 Tax=Pontibaca methylaminivorans TaxID=515897 RepID=A0A1R3X8C7_9RHOB|nr:COQ9 family protein [Pontibaca methylaminivorans]SIT87011.1 ubiquinone biosynthesis protein COQ9 [Pontibaca methylaminivorans]